MAKHKISVPFFEIGPKSYLYGDDVLALALAADKASEKYGVDVIFTCPVVEIRRANFGIYALCYARTSPRCIHIQLRFHPTGSVRVF